MPGDKSIPEVMRTLSEVDTRFAQCVDDLDTLTLLWLCPQLHELLSWFTEYGTHINGNALNSSDEKTNLCKHILQ